MYTNTYTHPFIVNLKLQILKSLILKEDTQAGNGLVSKEPAV